MPARFHDDAEDTLAILTTSEPVHHNAKSRTVGQQRKLRDKILEACKENLPLMIDDLKSAPDKALYLQAVEKEFRAMSDRGVLCIIDRNKVPAQSEIGQLSVLLARKRDGRYKSA